MRRWTPVSVSVVLVAVSVIACTACGGSSGPRISVSPSDALIDQPVQVTVTGVRPHERFALRAATKDRSGKPYLSETRVIADGRGRVELRGDRAMSLLWSVHPPGVSPSQSFTLYSYYAPSQRMRVTLSIVGARTTITRRFRASGVRVTKLRPPTDGFYGDFFAPPASFRGRRPAILSFGGSEGGNATTFSAALLASEGYPTLALAYFREPGLPHDLVRIPLEYFAKALRWLAAQPGVDPRKIVVKGVSRGSEAAQLLGIDYPRLVHAVIALVPSNGAVCGIAGTTDFRCVGPAWTFCGKPVPYFKNPSFQEANPHPFPDERINGPIFLVCGGRDNIWPSCPMSERIVSRLRAHDFRHTVTFLRYPNAGHGVGTLIPYYPGPDDYQLAGTTPQANQVARANAWPKLEAFLRAIQGG